MYASVHDLIVELQKLPGDTDIRSKVNSSTTNPPNFNAEQSVRSILARCSRRQTAKEKAVGTSTNQQLG